MEVLLIMTLLTTKTVTREQHFGETETKIQFFGLLHSCISPVFLSFLQCCYIDCHAHCPLWCSYHQTLKRNLGSWFETDEEVKKPPLPIFRNLFFYQSDVKESIYECMSHYQLWLWKEVRSSLVGLCLFPFFVDKCGETFQSPLHQIATVKAINY